MSVKIQKPKLLIVEGRDDQLCFEAALRDYLGLTDVQVMPIGGKTLLTRNLTGADRLAARLACSCGFG
jgi:hypothetical protein